MEALDETDTLQATLLFSLYDANGDGVLDENEFVQLVADLLCLRGDVLEVTPAVAYKLARPLAYLGFPGLARAQLTSDLFAALANRRTITRRADGRYDVRRGWAEVMADNRIGDHLPFWRPGPTDGAPWVPDILELNDPDLPKLIEELRRKRGAMRRVASSSKWVHDQPLKAFHGHEVEWLDEKIKTSDEFDKFELIPDAGDPDRGKINHTVIRPGRLAPEIEFWPVRRMARSMADVTPPKFSPPSVARKSADALANPPAPSRSRPRGDIRAAVNNHLRALGGRPRDRGADGNCFFLSLCGSLGEPLSNHLEKRRRTVEYLRTHRARFAAFSDVDFDGLLVEMAQDGSWVENLVVQAAADALNLDIRIFQDDGTRDVRIIPCAARNMDTRDAFLALYQIPGSEHYVEFEWGQAQIDAPQQSWFELSWMWNGGRAATNTPAGNTASTRDSSKGLSKGPSSRYFPSFDTSDKRSTASASTTTSTTTTTTMEAPRFFTWEMKTIAIIIAAVLVQYILTTD